MAGGVRVEGEDGRTVVTAFFVERLANDHPAPPHARVANGRDDNSIDAGVDHGASEIAQG
jgi:hypothetical protein